MDLLHLLLGENRCARGDPTQERDGASRTPLRGKAGVVVEQQLDRTRLGRVDPEVTLALEGLQVRVNGRARGQAEGLADLPNRGRVATSHDRIGYVRECLSLPLGQVLHSKPP
jgi:hypothetical protein